MQIGTWQSTGLPSLQLVTKRSPGPEPPGMGRESELLQQLCPLSTYVSGPGLRTWSALTHPVGEECPLRRGHSSAKEGGAGACFAPAASPVPALSTYWMRGSPLALPEEAEVPSPEEAVAAAPGAQPTFPRRVPSDSRS